MNLLGTNPNQAPRNMDLGALAYMNNLPITSVESITVTSASAKELVVNSLEAGGLSEIILPASPQSGSKIMVLVSNDRIDNIIRRNGKKIMGLNEDMTINIITGVITLVYVPALDDWRLA